MVLIDLDFLTTVSERELKSGLAEIIKYGFTFDQELWSSIRGFDKPELKLINKMVHRSVEIKNKVVLEDLHENSLRKSLNFGHTVGHAVESYFLEKEDKQDLTHGEAIAIGMVVELYYSAKLLGLPIAYASELKRFVNDFYGEIRIDEKDFDPIIHLMQFDKKNVGGKINFVLIDAMQVGSDLLKEGLRYFTIED